MEHIELVLLCEELKIKLKNPDAVQRYLDSKKSKWDLKKEVKR